MGQVGSDRNAQCNQTVGGEGTTCWYRVPINVKLKCAHFVLVIITITTLATLYWTLSFALLWNWRKIRIFHLPLTVLGIPCFFLFIVIGVSCICNVFPTTLGPNAPQFIVTSDPKLVTSDQKDFLPTHNSPDHKDIVVTDDDMWRRRTTNFWSACKCPTQTSVAKAVLLAVLSSVQK